VEFRREADREKIHEAQDLVESELESLPPEAAEGEEGDALRQQLNRLGTLAALQTGNAEVVQRADVPTDPSSPRPVRNAFIGGFIGLLLGLAVATLLERLDRRLREPADLEHAYGMPILSAVPDSDALSMDDDAAKKEALPIAELEALRMLRTQLRYFNVDRDVRTVMVTSASAKEGKSTVAWYLALSAAQAGVRTALLDADFHRATVSRRSGIAPIPGLSELLSGQAAEQGVVQSWALNGDTPGAGSSSLTVIAAGVTPPNPVELMESDRMAALIQRLRSEYDLVVIDTPPISVLADAIPITKLVDGVVVVGEVGRTTADEADRLRHQLSELGAPTLGVVANRVHSRRGYYAYGYADATPDGVIARLRR
jgi:capsular exopolysaccharide synthesis family protein